MTSESASQYCSGRKSRRRSPNQCPTTVCPLPVVMRKADSTAFLSLTGRSKVKETGMPTPTVDPFSGTCVAR